MNEELGIPTRPPTETGDPGGWTASLIPNSKFLIFLLISAIVLAAPRLATAKLAIFTDGRVLKVDDARLEGSEIVLDLKGGGTLRVSAVRVDRVIADEVEEPTNNGAFSDANCPAAWNDQELPDNLPFRESIASAAP